MKVVEYQYKPEYLARFPTSEREQMMKRQTGVIAQDLRRILPDAVETAGNVTLPGKGQVDDMLIVNKDRLFLENVGAVRELSKVRQRKKKSTSFIWAQQKLFCRVAEQLVSVCEHSRKCTSIGEHIVFSRGKLG